MSNECYGNRNQKNPIPGKRKRNQYRHIPPVVQSPPPLTLRPLDPFRRTRFTGFLRIPRRRLASLQPTTTTPRVARPDRNPDTTFDSSAFAAACTILTLRVAFYLHLREVVSLSPLKARARSGGTGRGGGMTGPGG